MIHHTHTQEYAVNDIVDGADGKQYIVFKCSPSRSVNPYVIIPIRGRGNGYKCLASFIKRKVGEAPVDHPALVAYRQRTGGVSDDYKEAVTNLCEAVEQGHWEKARALVAFIRENPA